MKEDNTMHKNLEQFWDAGTSHRTFAPLALAITLGLTFTNQVTTGSVAVWQVMVAAIFAVLFSAVVCATASRGTAAAR